METHLLSNWPELEKNTFTFTMTEAGNNTFTMTGAWKTLSLSRWPEQWSQQIRQIFWPYGLSNFIHKSAKESVSIYFYIGKNVSFLVNPRKGDNRYWRKLDNFWGKNLDQNWKTLIETLSLSQWPEHKSCQKSVKIYSILQMNVSF